jgi:hypothetical protein
MTDKLILFIGNWIIIEAQGPAALGTVIALALLSGVLALLYCRLTCSRHNIG